MTLILGRTSFNQKSQSLAASVENFQGRKSVCAFMPVNTAQNAVFGHSNRAEADRTQGNPWV